MNYTEAVRLALAGEQSGFNSLYKKTFQKKFFVALHYMQNRAAAEDVMQESYLVAFSKLNDLKNPEKFPGWFGMIVANRAKNALKKKNPMLFSDMAVDDDDEVFEYQIEDDNVDHIPETAYTKKETMQMVHELLDSLSEEQRMCILMKEVEGLSIKEIASQLGCSENTVKSRLKYGKDKIRKQRDELQKKGYQLYSMAPLPLLLYLLRKKAAYMTADGSLRAAGERVIENVVPYYGGQSSAGTSRRAQNAAGRSMKAAERGFIHTAAGKAAVAAAVLCLAGGTAVYGMSQLNKDENNKNTVEPEVMKEEEEIKPVEETPTAAVKEVQDADYAALIAGNLTKEELQFVLAYGPLEIPQQGFQSSDYLDIMNSLCDASGRNESGPIIEDYGPNENWVGQYSLSDINRMFRSFTDYQLAEDNNVLSEYNVQVQGNVVTFSGASIDRTSNAVITSASYTDEEMEIYYTYTYITTDMARDGIPQTTENKKAVLRPNADGLYQIVQIEMTGEPAEGGTVPEEQMPEEQAAEQPAEIAAIPVGAYSYVAPAGGFRGSLTIESESTATYVEWGSGTGAGNEIKYQIVVDNTVTVPDGVTAYLFQFVEGNNIQLTGNGFEVTGSMESGYNMSFTYDKNQGILQDSYGNMWSLAG